MTLTGLKCVYVRKSVNTLLILMLATLAVLAYYEYSNYQHYVKVFSCTNSWMTSYFSDFDSDSTTAATSEELSSPPTDYPEEEPLKNSTCHSSSSLVNWSCPHCFRPSVPHLQKSFQESYLNKSFSSDLTKTLFKAKSVVQELITDYLVVPNLNCSNVYLLAVQPSILDRKYERDVVRATWGSVAKKQKWPNRKINAEVKVIFVVATSKTKNNNSEILARRLKEVKSEAAHHNDILYLDMIDSYRNLTLKLVSAFKWVKDNCPCVKFVLKVDYDTFVNVPLLVDTLLYFENRFKNSIIGYVYESTKVRRSGKWQLQSSLYPMKTYMAYAAGCGYVLSFQALSKIVDMTPHVLMFSIEDVFITGVMRIVIGCQLFTFPTLFTRLEDVRWHNCYMLEDKKMLGTTKDSAKRHKLVWSAFQNNTCK